MLGFKWFVLECIKHLADEFTETSHGFPPQSFHTALVYWRPVKGGSDRKLGGPVALMGLG